jgi:hypothetical protein
LKLAEYRLGLSESGKIEELNNLRIRLSANEAKLLNLQAEKSSLVVEIERLETRNKELCQAALEKRRTRTQGMKFETFSVKDGRTFKNAIITAVGDSGVAFRHENGAARLRYAELTEDQRLFFGLDEKASLAAEDRERRLALAYELSIDMELEAMRDKASETRIEPVVARNKSRAMIAATSNHENETRPLAQSARPFGSGSSYRRWYGYSGYRSYRPVYRYVYQYPSATNPFCPVTRPCSPSSGVRSGTLPSGTLPSGTLPSGTLPSGTLPSGTLPSETLPSATTNP